MKKKYMKNMKKNIAYSILVASVLVTSFFNIHPVSADQPPINHEYQQYFEEYDPGDYYTNTSWYNTSLYGVTNSGAITFHNDGENITTTADSVYNGTYGFNIKRTSGGNSGFSINLTDNDDQYNISYFSFWVSQHATGTEALYCQIMNETRGSSALNTDAVISLQFVDGSNIEFVDGNGAQNAGTYVEDTWYFIKIEFDWDNQQCDCYVNDSLELDDSPFRGTNTLEGVKFIMFNTASSSNGNFSIDNISIGSPVTIGEGGEEEPDEYPYINATAFNASLTNVGGVYSITFKGDQNEELWCNDTNSLGNETLNVTIVDGNQSVQWVNISLADIDDTPDIDAEDFELYAYNTSTSSWETQGSFPPGGGNISISDGLGATFPVSGNHTFLFRFKLTVDADQTKKVYEETIGCSVYIDG